MKGVRKAFDRKLHAEHDEKARSQAKKLFAQMGLDALDNPNKYGVDLILMKEGRVFFLAEVEIKNNWNSPVFPFSTLQLPERKARYATEYSGKMFYVILSKDQSQALVFTDHALKDLKPVEVSNRFVAKGEYFFQIPVDRCRLIKIL